MGDSTHSPLDTRILAARSAASRALIERLRKPVFIVDCEVHVAMRNAAAARLVAMERSPLCIRSGRLRSIDPQVQAGIRVECLELAQEHTSTRAKAERFLPMPAPWDRGYFGISIGRIIPEPSLRAYDVPRQLLVTVHPHTLRGEAPVGLWKAVFALTAAEAKIAAELWEGRSLKEASARAGVALSTARSQLNSVLRKTRAKRQAELMRALDALAEANDGPL